MQRAETLLQSAEGCPGGAGGLMEWAGDGGGGEQDP